MEVTLSDSSREACLPSRACSRSFSAKVVTSSRINSFSNSSSFLLFNLSSSTYIFAYKASSSGSSPLSSLNLFSFSGSSNLSLSYFFMIYTITSSFFSWITFSALFGISGHCFLATTIFLLISYNWMFIVLTSSSICLVSVSPFLKMFSWMFAFS